MRYPNGIKLHSNKKNATSKKIKNYSNANRGMDLEADINISNQFYIDNDICLITKRPTPINVVKVDYSKGARITDAYFEKQSTTDYNGVYRGRYIDFEAKNTKNKTSFPLSNITSHQIKHLERVIQNGGIAFFIICFESLNEVFILDASFIINFIKKEKRKSIPHDSFIEHGVLIEQLYNPRLDYIKAVNRLYFEDR